MRERASNLPDDEHGVVSITPVGLFAIAVVVAAIVFCCVYIWRKGN
jgi:hypothetical protein